MNGVFHCRHFGAVALVFASTIVLTSCSDKKPPSATRAGQTVVKVNDREITVHQVNTELQSLDPALLNAPEKVVQQRIVESLIDRELLAMEAKKMQLDRDPQVMQAVERAKTQIVAQAYLQKKIAATPGPTAAEISEYFQKHPELFSKRKLYDMQLVTIPVKDFRDEARAFVDTAKSIHDVEGWLNKKGIGFTRAITSKSSADLPPTMREKLDELVKGRPFVLRDSATVIIATLAYVKDAPVGEQEAVKQIEQALVTTRSKALMTTEVARLRKDARIDYVNGKPPVTPDATPAGPNNMGTSVEQKQIERGMAGLH